MTTRLLVLLVLLTVLPAMGMLWLMTRAVAMEAIIGLEPSQIERPGSPSMTCWRSKGRSPGFQSDAVWTTR